MLLFTIRSDQLFSQICSATPVSPASPPQLEKTRVFCYIHWTSSSVPYGSICHVMHLGFLLAASVAMSDSSTNTPSSLSALTTTIYTSDWKRAARRCRPGLPSVKVVVFTVAGTTTAGASATPTRPSAASSPACSSLWSLLSLRRPPFALFVLFRRMLRRTRPRTAAAALPGEIFDRRGEPALRGELGGDAESATASSSRIVCLAGTGEHCGELCGEASLDARAMSRRRATCSSDVGMCKADCAIPRACRTGEGEASAAAALVRVADCGDVDGRPSRLHDEGRQNRPPRFEP